MQGEPAVLLVVGSGDRAYREYLLRAIARRHPIWLFDPDPPSWQLPYVSGCTVLDVFDPAAVVPAALDLQGQREVAGVFSYHEGTVLATAHAGAALGLPGPAVDGVTACRDKGRTRELLTAAGLPQPRFAHVATLAEAAEAAERIGYPVVCKPRGLGASQGVVRVDEPEQLEWALGVAQSATQRGMTTTDHVLVEEFLEGPEVSVDAAVTPYGVLPIALAHKRLGREPYFEEVGHLVTAADPLLADAEFLELLAAAHRALGFSGAVTHTEVKFTERGPVVIEVNARLGGDLIPHVGEYATGVAAGEVAADLALGRVPVVEPARRTWAGIRFLCPPADCVVRSVTVPEPRPGLVEATVLARPGEELRLPPRGYVSRHAYVVTTAETADDCERLLGEVAAEVELDWEPL